MNTKINLLILLLVLLQVFNLSNGTRVVAQEISLISPVDKFHTSDFIIVFTWNKEKNALSYEVQVAKDSLYTDIYYSSVNLDLTDTISGFAIGQNYFWRVRYFDGVANSNWTSSRRIILIDPKAYSNLNFWIDAGRVSDTTVFGNVNMAEDLSGENLNVFQNEAGEQPVIVQNTLNGKPVIRFDGVDDFIEANNKSDWKFLHNGTSHTTFILCKINNANSYYQSVLATNELASSSTGFCVVHNDNPATNINNGLTAGISKGVPSKWVVYSNGLSDVFPDQKFVILSTKYDAVTEGALEQKINTVLVNKIYAGNFPHSSGDPTIPLRIGALANSSYGFANMDLAEVIIYDKALSDSEMNTIEQYLRFKYAPQINLGRDITLQYGVCDTLIDAGSGFTDYLWSTGATTQSIVVTRPGKYAVQAKDIFGFLTTDTIEVNFPYNQLADIEYLCVDNSIVWNTKLNKSDYSFEWQDGSADSLFTITQTGSYWVKVTDTLGCSVISDTSIVVLDNFSNNASLGNDATLCTGNELELASGYEPGIIYQWSTGSSDSIITINLAGNYWLKATNIHGCVLNDTINISINGNAPSPLFSAPNSCANEAAVFNNLSTAVNPDVIIGSIWDFGDGNSSTSNNSAHLYSVPGTYYVKLTVSTNSGCSKVIKKPITIYQVPDANFASSLACSGKAVSFTDSSSVINGSVDYWKWDFGVASALNDTSLAQNSNYSYQSTGNYNVSLVISALGCRDTLIQQIKVEESPAVNYSFNNVCIGNAVQLNNTSSIPLPGAISEFLWKFGDGNSSFATNPVHLYSNSGTYDILLIAESSKGCVDTLIKTIKIHNYPLADFSNTLPCLNQPVQFTDISTIVDDSIVSWFWFLESNKNSALQNPLFTYSDTGSKDIKLIVTTNGGCTSVKTMTIQMYPSPVADFEFLPQVAVVNGIQAFVNQSQGGLSYNWDFGNNSQSILSEPTTTYSDTGKYNVTLTAVNQFGCTDNYSTSISALKPLLDVSASKISINRNGNFATITGEISNVGSYEIYNLDLYLQTSNGVPVKEPWIGVLPSGSKQAYKFNAQAYLPELFANDFICFKVYSPNGTIDENSSNDEMCAGVGEASPILMEPYPSPAYDILNIKYIIPASGKVEISIYDISGNVTQSVYNSEDSAGGNHLLVDISSLQDGVYAVRMSYDGQLIVKKFIKNSAK